MRNVKFVYGWHGFGIGAWRSVMGTDKTIWTVCIGPLPIFIAVYP